MNSGKDVCSSLLLIIFRSYQYISEDIYKPAPGTYVGNLGPDYNTMLKLANDLQGPFLFHSKTN